MVFHVCGSDACKRLQINVPEKLLKDRDVPRGEDAAALKGYINILKPSHAQRNKPSSFPCCCKKVASGWDGKRRGMSLESLAPMPHATAGCPPVALRTPWQHPCSHHPKGGRCRSAPSESCQEPELYLLFDQTPDSFCMRGGDEPIRYTCHKLFLDH